MAREQRQGGEEGSRGSQEESRFNGLRDDLESLSEGRVAGAGARPRRRAAARFWAQNESSSTA